MYNQHVWGRNVPQYHTDSRHSRNNSEGEITSNSNKPKKGKTRSLVRDRTVIHMSASHSMESFVERPYGNRGIVTVCGDDLAGGRQVRAKPDNTKTTSTGQTHGARN
jgi:hypothetical protein